MISGNHRTEIHRFVLAFLRVTFAFTIVYLGADTFTQHRTDRFPLYFSWELDIPLWPWTVLVYNSLYGMFLVLPFFIRGPSALRHLEKSFLSLIVLSGIGFLLLPAELGFFPAQTPGFLGAVLRASDALNLDYNLVPSLHVGLAAVGLSALFERVGRRAKIFLILWGVAIAASTVTTHQHHVVDVFAGGLLGVFCFRLFDRSNVRRPMEIAAQEEST